MVSRFLRDESATTAIEYAVIASLIAVALFVSIEPIGDALSAIFGSANDGLAQ